METQTRYDLNAGRRQAFRIAVVFLVFYLWQTVVSFFFEALRVAAPALNSHRMDITQLGLAFTYDAIIALPLIALAVGSQWPRLVSESKFWRRVAASRWLILGCASALLIAIRYVHFYLLWPRIVATFQYRPLRTAPLLNWGNLWPAMLIAIVFWLYPSPRKSKAPTREEDETTFNLEMALEEWRQELTAQTTLGADARRELETHLRDTIAELQRGGLATTQAFTLARQRLGPPIELGQEFEKADTISRQRAIALWVAASLLVWNLWQDLIHALWATFVQQSWGVSQIIVCLPVFCLAYWSARGRLQEILPRLWQSAFRNRTRFLFWASGLILALRVLPVRQLGYLYLPAVPPLWHWSVWELSNWLLFLVSDFVLPVIWPLALATIVFCLLPRRGSKRLAVA